CGGGRGVRGDPGPGTAALAAPAPPMLFTGMLLSEPFAYPLALAVVAVALAVVEHATLRLQAALLVLGALASLTRLQLAVLPLCAVATVLVVAAREGRLRRYLPLVGVTALGLSRALAFTLVHRLGYSHLAPKVPDARIAGLDVYVVLLATGVAIVPSALVGLALALVRPRTRAELAFGLLTSLFIAALVGQSVLWGDTGQVQERYLG